ncbi:putative protein conserved in bacteria, partial [Dysosmobacter welbionis]
RHLGRLWPKGHPEGVAVGRIGPLLRSRQVRQHHPIHRLAVRRHYRRQRAYFLSPSPEQSRAGHRQRQHSGRRQRIPAVWPQLRRRFHTHTPPNRPDGTG